MGLPIEGLGGVIIGVVILVVLLYAVPRLTCGNTMVCNRCDGSGQVDEHWPDPQAPGGFHEAHGRCPKCKGKGRIKL